MGTWTLAHFQSELQDALGGVDLGDTKEQRIINAAYREVASAKDVDFKGEITETTFVTTDGAPDESLPTDFLGMIAVVDETNDRTLLRLEYRDYHTRNPDADAEGKPTHWATDDDCVWLWPTPDTSDETIRLVYWGLPSLLSDAAHVTVLPATYDYAVHLLSVHNAMLVRGEEDRASVFFSRYLGYMQSRKTDRDWSKESRARGLQVAWSEEDLTDQQT